MSCRCRVRDRGRNMTKKCICRHCGAEVWWGMPRPEDPCYECGKPIALEVKEDKA